MRKTARDIVALAFSLSFSLSLGLAWGADADQEIRIGMSAPFSGTAAAYGRAMRDTMQLVFDQANRQGGVNGKSIRLISHDDAYENARALSNTRRLVEED